MWSLCSFWRLLLLLLLLLTNWLAVQHGNAYCGLMTSSRYRECSRWIIQATFIQLWLSMAECTPMYHFHYYYAYYNNIKIKFQRYAQQSWLEKVTMQHRGQWCWRTVDMKSIQFVIDTPPVMLTIVENSWGFRMELNTDWVSIDLIWGRRKS